MQAFKLMQQKILKDITLAIVCACSNLWCLYQIGPSPPKPTHDTPKTPPKPLKAMVRKPPTPKATIKKATSPKATVYRNKYKPSANDDSDWEATVQYIFFELFMMII